MSTNGFIDSRVVYNPDSGNSVHNEFGVLSQLNTTAKDSLVNALNEHGTQLADIAQFNAKNYGAKGDGGTDNISAIQTAINAASANGGGVVLLPPGVFIVSATPTTWIQLKDNVTIRGSGPFTTIRLKNNNGDFNRLFGAASDSTTLKNVCIENLTIDLNTQNNTTASMINQSSPTYSNTLQDAIAIYNFNNLKIERVRFINCSSVNIITVNAAIGNTGVDGTDLVVDKCYFQFVYQAGNTYSYDNTCLYVNAQNYTLSNNYFTTTVNSGCRTAYEAHWGQGVCKGNTVENFMTGAFVDGANKSGVQDNIIVNSNSFRNVNSGILIDPFGTTYNCANVIISDNTVYLTQKDWGLNNSIGIGTVYATNSQSLIDTFTIQDNLIVFQDEGSSGRAGVTFEAAAGINVNSYSGANNVLVQGNIVKNAPGRGIALGQNTSTNSLYPNAAFTNIKIRNNHIINPGQNSQIDQWHRAGIGIVYKAILTDVDISGNTIIDNLNRCFYGIFFDGTSTNTRVKLNDNSVSPTLQNSYTTGVQYKSWSQASSVPTSGYYSQGHMIWNSSPSNGGVTAWNTVTGGNACGTAWATGTAYTVGQQVYNGSSVYQCVTAGTSGATAPTGTGTNISDGVCVWNYVSPLAVFAQAGINAQNKFGEVAVTSGNTSVTIPLSQTDTSYRLVVTPNWNTTYWFSNKGTSNATITFGTAPASTGYLDWVLYR
jgi:hypothetical protein